MSAVVTDLIFKQPINAPAPTGTQGGAIGSTQITAGSNNLWLCPLASNPSSVAVQYALAYLVNNNGSSSITNVGFWLGNGMIVPTTPGVVTLQSSDAADNNLTALLYLEPNGGSGQVAESVALNGTSVVSGAITTDRAWRITTVNSGGVVTAPVGTVTVKVSSQIIGYLGVMATTTTGTPISVATATSEFAFCPAGSLGDMATFTNSSTDPGPGSYVLCNAFSNAIFLAANPSNTLAHGQYGGIYCKMSLQAGMPPLSAEDLFLTPYAIAV